jgi:hypothetical protein
MAAAHWAIHDGIRAGRLRTGLITVEYPSWQNPGQPWQGGGQGTIAIPNDQPTPFDAFVVIATEALWNWWRNNDQTKSSRGATPVSTGMFGSPRVGSERPSPFTIPEPQFQFEGTANEQRPARKMTVGGMIHKLNVFADYYERATDDVNSKSSPFDKHYFAAGRDANADSMSREFRSAIAIDRIRAHVLGKFGAELTIGTARRFLGDLIRTCNLTTEAAEGLKLEEAMDRLDAASTSTKPAPTVPTETNAKRSTERGEGRAKVIAALTKHHQYADGSCLNLEPIGNNEVAKVAGVSASTASTFFNEKFDGHTKYKALCRDTGKLIAALKLLNNEFAPHDLYGRRPAGEDDRDEE